MALAEMTKARLAVHRIAAGGLASKLQALGCCEFVSPTSAEKHDGFASASVLAERSRIDDLLADVRFLERLLEPYAENKGGGMAVALGDVPQRTLTELSLTADEQKFGELTNKARAIESALTKTRAEITRLRALLVQAEMLSAVRWPLEFFTLGTGSIIGMIYAVPKANIEELTGELTRILGELVDFQIIEGGAKEKAVKLAVLFEKTSAEAVQSAVAASGASRIEVPKDFSSNAEAEAAQITQQLAALAEDEKQSVNALAHLANDNLAFLRDCGDYWEITKKRLDAMASGVPTEEVLIWDFWTPKSSIPKIKEIIAEYTDSTEFAGIQPNEGEEPPTLLKNAPGAACCEPLTIMFGTPTYGKLDPTAKMAPFFYLFLGMCFGDAGYGLLVGGVLAFFLARHSLTPTLRKFFSLMLIGMVCTVIFGALTGSWFGDAIFAFPFLEGAKNILGGFQVLDPMKDPMTLLAISLALGFVQVLFGLALAFYENWRSGDKFEAVADQGGWIIFLIGLVATGLSLGGVLSSVCVLPSEICAVAGAAILVLTQGREKKNILLRVFSGIMSLYNVTGFLGDVLSYSRLLALGLGSAAVGMVINLLCKLVSGTPYVGIVCAVLIFVIGHVFSIAVNLLGAFIHSLRLQYVEFFGKFYTATGHDFTPLTNAARYSKIIG